MKCLVRNTSSKVNSVVVWQIPYMDLGTFHFLWECLRVVFMMFWGTPSLHGSLCNMREVCKLVDKGVKVFNVGDEFLNDVFHSHLRSAIFHHFNISSTSDTIDHSSTKQWLYNTAEKIASSTLTPVESKDPTYFFHRLFMHHAFMYINLRHAMGERTPNSPTLEVVVT